MSDDPAGMLAIFLSIDPKIIERDQREAKGQLKRVVDSISSLRSGHYKNRTPEIESKISHLMMIQAYELANMPNVEPEFKTFYASFGASEIVNNAETAAFNKGRLAELSRKMEEIRKREGLADGEYWYRHQGPADHQTLEIESDEIIEKVSDTIFVHVLRRYSLGEQADLYEQNRAQYEILREIGARVLMGDTTPPDIQEMMDACYSKNYGKAALEAIRKRTKELRRSRGLAE